MSAKPRFKKGDEVFFLYYQLGCNPQRAYELEPQSGIITNVLKYYRKPIFGYLLDGKNIFFDEENLYATEEEVNARAN